MKKIISIFVLTLMLSCNNKEAANFDITKVKSHIENLNKSYGNRFFKNDSKMYEDLYTKDAVIMPENSIAIKGREEIFKYYYNNGENKVIKIDLIVNGVYGGEELISEEGEYTIKDDKNTELDNGKFIALWKKENNKWKLFREIWNTNKSLD